MSEMTTTNPKGRKFMGAREKNIFEEALWKDYTDRKLKVADILKKHKIGSKRFYDIIRARQARETQGGSRVDQLQSWYTPPQEGINISNPGDDREFYLRLRQILDS